MDTLRMEDGVQQWVLVCLTRRGREPPSGQEEKEMRVKIVCLHKDINAHLNGRNKRNTKMTATPPNR